MKNSSTTAILLVVAVLVGIGGYILGRQVSPGTSDLTGEAAVNRSNLSYSKVKGIEERTDTVIGWVYDILESVSRPVIFINGLLQTDASGQKTLVYNSYVRGATEKQNKGVVPKWGGVALEVYMLGGGNYNKHTVMYGNDFDWADFTPNALLNLTTEKINANNSNLTLEGTGLKTCDYSDASNLDPNKANKNCEDASVMIKLRVSPEKYTAGQLVNLVCMKVASASKTYFSYKVDPDGTCSPYREKNRAAGIVDLFIGKNIWI